MIPELSVANVKCSKEGMFRHSDDFQERLQVYDLCVHNNLVAYIIILYAKIRFNNNFVFFITNRSCDVYKISLHKTDLVVSI